MHPLLQPKSTTLMKAAAQPRTVRKSNRLPGIHPGQILLHEFLEPSEISQYRLARATGLPASRISDLVKGRRGITPDSAIRLGKALGMSPQFWLNLQQEYDMREATCANAKAYASIPLLIPVAA